MANRAPYLRFNGVVVGLDLIPHEVHSNRKVANGGRN